MTRTQREGLLLIFLASLGFSFFPIITKNIYNISDLEPFDISIWRFIFATPLIWLTVVMRSSEKTQERLPRKQLVGLGAWFSLAALTAFFGLQRISASLFVIIFFTYPMMVAVLSALGGQHLSRLAWLAIFLALIGVALTANLTNLNNIDLIGVALALINAAVAAIFYLANNRVMSGYHSMTRATAWMITGTLFVMLLLIPIRGLQVPGSLDTALNLVALGAISTALPLVTTTAAIQKLGPAPTAIMSTVEPVMATVWALLLLQEVLLPIQWLGALLVIFSVLLLQVRPAKQTPSLETT